MLDLEKKSLELRRKIVKTCFLGRAGHIPPSLSALDIMTSLYFGNIMIYDPKNPKYENRDRFILSKGHASLALYNVLCDAGFFSRSELNTFCQPGTIFGAHPTPKIPGIEAATGALGHGLCFAVGEALSARLLKKKWLTYVVTGDGECQEGSIWEAAMSISKFNLTNLIWIIDRNKWQANGKVADIMNLDPFEDKLRAFGFDVKNINGHDYTQLIKTLKINREHFPLSPIAVIANTHKGNGIPFIQDKKEWHSRIPSNEEFDIIIKQLDLTKEEFDKL